MGKVRSRAALVVLAATTLSLGCGPARVRLWPEEWTRSHVGALWQRGVPAGGARRFEAARRGYLWRARAVNAADGPGEVLVEGARGKRAWRVGSGATEDLEWALAEPGTYSVSTSPGLILGEPRLVRPHGDAPLVVLLLADTLRGDHVNESLTPRLLAAFHGGERFTEAISNASWTLPSVASLFTSRPLLDLTAVDGGLIGVPVGVPTWAEALEKRGMSGGAVVANFTVNVPNEFGRGFDSYSVPKSYGPEGHPDAAWVLARARQWLRAHQGEPGFLYLQFMDQHEPYHDHEGGMAPMAEITPLASRAREAGPEETRQRRDAYASTVRYLDRQLGPFLAELPPQAVVAFTADHGEAFGEHGCWGHGLNLYREAIHVPLLLRGPGVPALLERRPVQLLDLAPTLLDLAGCPRPPGMRGRTLRRGGSAEPLVAATFGGGPLRWLWREGSREVLVHTRPQPGLAPEAEVKLQEVRPLPSGVFGFDLVRDPEELHPDPLDDASAFVAARVFATSVGRLAPGLQVLSAGEHGPTTVAFGTPVLLHVTQVFSISPTRVEATRDRVEVRWDDPFPFALAVFAAGASVRPAKVGGSSWTWLPGVGPPLLERPGSFLWRNERDDLVQRGYEETIKRLRSLGYVQ